VNTHSPGLTFLTSGGASGRAIAATDWSDHPLGPIDGWPAALRTAMSMVLSSGFPSYVAWGRRFHVFYNDAYMPILGNKVDIGQGRPLGELWHEIGEAACAIAERAYQGETTAFTDMPYTINRHGHPEQAFFTFSYSPIRDPDGSVQGVLGVILETTDKVIALARQQASEARLQLSLDASGNIGTWSVELDTMQTVVDARFARLFQVDAALAQSGTELERFTTMIHPDDRERVNAAIAASMGHGEPYDIDYRIPQLSGKIIWVNAKGGIFADPQSGRKRFAGVAVDITERKQADEARRLYAERQAFQLRLSDMLRPLTAADDIIAAAVTLLGAWTGAARVFYTEVDALQRSFTIRKDWAAGEMASLAGMSGKLDDFDPAMIARMERCEAAVIEDIERDVTTAPHLAAYAGMGTRAHLAVPLLKHGRLIAILGIHRIAPWHWSAGEVELVHEVAGRIWAAVDSACLQAALRREQRQSEDILEGMAEGFILLDADWTFLAVNEVGAQVAQRSRAAMIGQNQWTLIPETLGTPVEELFRRVQSTRQGGTLEYQYTQPNGNRTWLEIRAYAVAEDRLALFFRDIGERKRVEQELSEGVRRKDEFLAMLAHELRNPLAPIGAAADLLSIAALDQAGVRRTSAVIARQVRHMTGLVDDLLDVSRVTRGLVTLEQEVVDVGRIVADAIEQVRPLLEARAHRFMLHQDSEAMHVVGDHKRLVQVLTNLLNNAAKYTPEGGNIALRTEAQGERVLLAVVDDGIGMQSDLKARAFEMFAQAERSPDRAQGGLGLGLALVKSLVELHQGSVLAESEGTGTGSEFSVWLPRVASPPAPDRDGAVVRASAASALRVLIVDDNADAATMLAMLLEASGHSVMVEHDAGLALARARSEAPDVCLLDIGLPDMDGNELARRLRLLPETRHALLIAATGYGQAADRSSSAAAGFDHHLVKPLDIAQLTTLLNGVKPA
jgi:PAS domain S-box-containing protein